MHTSRRVFDWSSQEQFALASCDFNPIHMDSAAARRTQSGAPIVHGIHSLLWILDCAAQARMATEAASSLKVQFLQPVYLGDEAIVEITRPRDAVLRARMLVDGEEVLTMSCSFDGNARGVSTLQPRGECLPPPERPADLSLSEMKGLTGCLSFTDAIAKLDAMFPHASRVFGSQRIAALAGSSCLVGMVVPGLHSMYSGLEVSFCDDSSAPADALVFSVDSVVERFRLVRISIGSRGLRGSLETVSRMPPIRQRDISHLRSVVAANEFRDCRPLIIGGSRGLGELTAKVIAAGGGHPIITYATGKLEADALVKELAGSGAQWSAMSYDVRRAATEQLVELAMPVTHVYYFATPPIFRRKVGLFDERRFAEFRTFYISGFFDLVQACLRRGSRGLRLFYPSSTAIDERPATMTEYSMAKAAGEVLCADLSRFEPEVKIIVKRLPRLPTDQTNSVVKAKTADALEVILPIVREMQATSLPADVSSRSSVHNPAPADLQPKGTVW